MNNNSIFIEKLRSSGLRPTKQRIEICKLLFDRKKTIHFTISVSEIELKSYETCKFKYVKQKASK